MRTINKKVQAALALKLRELAGGADFLLKIRPHTPSQKKVVEARRDAFLEAAKLVGEAPFVDAEPEEGATADA